MLSRRVDLPSGGYLIIDYAEALTVIDVNSGSFIGRGKGAGLEDTITKTNLEAAEEVVNQLRLRDIGGIIVIDFIDMARARNRDAVMKTLRKTLDEDRTKTFTAEISKLGLVEMTRQNVTEGVREIMSRAVPDVRGRGRDPLGGDDRDRVRAPLRDVAAETPRRRGLPRADQPARHAPSSPATARACCTRSRPQTGKSFLFEGSEGLALDHFAITFQGTREEVEERALPFRQGDEVLVEIVEPHMYDVDDAVAKIDGYIISIAGAAAHVGEKRMVRIDQVGRTAASALLLDESGEVVRAAARARTARATGGRGGRRSAVLRRGRASRRARAVARPRAPRAGRQRGRRGAPRSRPARVRRRRSTPSPSRTRPVAPTRRRAVDGRARSRRRRERSQDDGAEDGLQSKPRRRGRRGGRRRSAAKATATPE